MQEITTTSTIKFCNKELELLYNDRVDVQFLQYLSQIEFAELYHGDGILWYKHLKENYGLKFGDTKTETKIENILIANKDKGLEKPPQNGSN